MLNHPKFKQIRHELQGNYHYFYQLCQSLYQRYCPRCVTQRVMWRTLKSMTVDCWRYCVYKQRLVSNHNAVFGT